MTAAEEMMAYGFFGFSSVAALTWCFSHQPRLFIRVFVPREDLRGAIRAILRDPHFGPGVRTIALLQFGVALVFGAVGWWLGFG